MITVSKTLQFTWKQTSFQHWKVVILSSTVPIQPSVCGCSPLDFWKVGKEEATTALTFLYYPQTDKGRVGTCTTETCLNRVCIFLPGGRQRRIRHRISLMILRQMNCIMLNTSQIKLKVYWTVALFDWSLRKLTLGDHTLVWTDTRKRYFDSFSMDISALIQTLRLIHV